MRYRVLVLLSFAILWINPNLASADCADLGRTTGWYVESSNRVIFYVGRRPLVSLNISDCTIDPSSVEALKPGITESQVAAAAEYAMRQAGAEEFWRTYVSSGPRTNIAHGLPTLRKLETGDLVMIDIHPIVNAYSTDLCRTICVGKPTDEQKTLYDLYLKAQQATIARVKSGVGMIELEETLHGIIKDAGHGGHLFGPPIHGVGLEFEESPLPPGHAFFHGEKEPPPLEANMVIAVGNCGLYTGPWGVRVEDTILVGPDGPTILTESPRELAP